MEPNASNGHVTGLPKNRNRRTSGMRSASFFAQSMDSTATTQNPRKGKVLLIVGLIVLAILFLAVAFYVIIRNQVGGGVKKGAIDVQDFNARIDYQDEMNCYRKEEGHDSSHSFRIVANDLWSKVAVYAVDLEGSISDMVIINDRVYVTKYEDYYSNMHAPEFGGQYYYDFDRTDTERYDEFRNSLKLAVDQGFEIYCEEYDDKYLRIEDTNAFVDMSSIYQFKQNVIKNSEENKEKENGE